MDRLIYKSKSFLILLVSIFVFLLSGCFDSRYVGVISTKNEEFNRVLVIQEEPWGQVPWLFFGSERAKGPVPMAYDYQ